MSADNAKVLNIPGYRIDKRIGEGGMASVYLAIQESLDRPVALKVLSSDFSASPEFSKRFLNEGKILASLLHTNIITIFDFGIDDGVHYICMEYVEGNDLKSRIRAGIKPSTALDYIETLAGCLHVAHRRNIVHRDMKPANVLFRDDGTLLLTDFGIAKQLDETSDLTITGSTLGSPHYLSPEQAQSRPVDGRADIYSLGIMLYEMIVRQKPYRGDSEINTVLKHITDPIPALPEHLQSFQPLLEKMIAKAPSDRFSNVTELIEALRAFRSDEQELLSKLDALVLGPAPSSSLKIHQLPADAKPGLSSAQADTMRLAASANTTMTQTCEPSTQTLAMTSEDEMDTEAPSQRDSLTSASLRMPRAGRDMDTKVLAPGGENKTRSFLLLGGAAVVTVSVIVGISLWATRSADMPASVSGTAKRAELVKSVTSPPESSSANVSRHAEMLESTEQTTPASEPSAMPSTEPDLAQEIAAREERREMIADLLRRARIAIEEFRLTKPEGNNALDYFQMVLEIDPENEQAKVGPASIAQRYGELARSQLGQHRYSKADEYVHKGLELAPTNPKLLALRAQIRQSTLSNSSKKGRKEDTPKELYDRVKKLFD